MQVSKSILNITVSTNLEECRANHLLQKSFLDKAQNAIANHLRGHLQHRSREDMEEGDGREEEEGKESER